LHPYKQRDGECYTKSAVTKDAELILLFVIIS